ncbi:carbon-nitrogen hydrolase family protein [Nocardioides sambongensis]|uniref:carbon-nitrogen hydrolase family protein n=1 Tax=Nocardioides sambongensis TaxID=2589074 RepID=UPI001E5ADDE9|nr:carbon-nitrogen hydrolase family protein [Nocardioides sambongensis]
MRETTDRPAPTRPLRITLVQAASSLEPADNRAALDRLVPRAEGAERPDLVVLPEAFARDFGSAGSDVSPFAEPLDGPFGSELARVAEDRGTTVVAGMFEAGPDPERPYNTLLVRGAAAASYRKVHLYDSFGYRESDRLSAGGVAPTVVEVGGWRVGLMTCYDLRFPEMARSLVDAGADVLVLPAAWVAGEGKVHHWRTLLTARAIENTVYVAAAGQPAPRYCGTSLVLDPMGREIAALGESEDPATTTAVADPELLLRTRDANPSLRNRRL